jgi:hypothetical protein
MYPMEVCAPHQIFLVDLRPSVLAEENLWLLIRVEAALRNPPMSGWRFDQMAMRYFLLQ